MNIHKKWWLLVSMCMILLFGCSNEALDSSANENEHKELIVSAAASLTDAMGEIEKVYEGDHPETDLTFNFAGSGTLAQQIDKGAPVDVFISANENWMQKMIEKEFINEKERQEVTGNRLVLIAAKNSGISFESFSDIDRGEEEQIAIGNPESVPAGEYTETVLNKLDKWDVLEDLFVYAKDVRQVLTYVETGNAEIGFVYESDALSSDKVEIIAYSDPEDHEPIIYPGAVLQDSEHQEEGKLFLEFLQSDEGQQILKEYGFTNEG